MSNSFNTFYKTFSGADTIAFVVLPNTKPIVLGTLTTISYSTFRIKKPVNLINRINVSGYTRGVRTVAGTMIFTLINQHWVNEIIDEIECLQQFENLKPDELPIFDIILVSGNEYGSGIIGTIYGVDVTDDSGVISVNDLYTELTVSFLARDVELFKEFGKEPNGKPLKQNIALDKYSVQFGLDDVLRETYKIDKPKSIYDKEDGFDVSYVNKSIDMNNIDLDYTLCELDELNNTDVYTKSYYTMSNEKSYMYKVKSNKLNVRDIINALIYSNTDNMYPKNIECLVRNDKHIIKINISIKDGDN